MVANAQKLFEGKKKGTKQCMARNKEIWKKKAKNLRQGGGLLMQ